ncbi:MAG: substrate-binding domain-containing protein [Bacteroidales bacterium]|nr:substrate-binding domain-containing protein [Bacteroidales bacterium]
MKYFNFRTIVLVALVFCGTLLKAQETKPKIGFILANLYVDRWHSDKNMFQDEINRLGGEVIFIDAYDNADNQVKAASKLVSDGVDLLVVVPVDGLSASKIVDIGHKAGIKVIAYDRLIMNSNLDYYISFNSIKVGELMAGFVVEKIPAGTILNVCGPLEDNNSFLIKDGVKNVLDPLVAENKYKVSHVHVSTWNPLDAYLLVEQYLTRNPMPGAIICAADVLARGVAELLQLSGDIGNVIITGQDAELEICKMIVNGDIGISVYKPIPLLAETAARIAMDIVKGKEINSTESVNNGFIDVPAIFLEPIPVTKETIDENIIESGYYTREQVYGK